MTKWDATIAAALASVYPEIGGGAARPSRGERAIARAVELATIEACARACEAIDYADPYADGLMRKNCVDAIRALAKEE